MRISDWGSDVCSSDLAARREEAFQPAELLRDDALPVGAHRHRIDAVKRRLDADGRGITRRVCDFGRVQERLGGDAAAVQARTADLVLLHDDDGGAQLCGAQCGGVAATAPAQDDEVGGVFGHAVASTVSSSMSARTVAPVTPLSTNPYGAPLFIPTPAMSRCTHGIRGDR